MAVHTPVAVTGEPKIYEVMESGEVPPNGGRGGNMRVTRGYPYTKETYLGDDICVNTGVLSFWSPLRMCFFGVCVVDTDVPS